MGVNFSHCENYISYRGFHNFRGDLAAQAGIRLWKMKGYGGVKAWDELDDPIKLLFTDHDEYGGKELAPEQCLLLKRRIRDLTDQWSDEKVSRPHSWKPFAEEFIKGLAKAAFLGERFFWF
jgi:hypothetical protein